MRGHPFRATTMPLHTAQECWLTAAHQGSAQAMILLQLTVRQSLQLICVIKVAGQASGSLIRHCCPADIAPKQVISDDVGQLSVEVLQQLQCSLGEEYRAGIAKQHPLVASLIQCLHRRDSFLNALTFRLTRTINLPLCEAMWDQHPQWTLGFLTQACVRSSRFPLSNWLRRTFTTLLL